MFLTTLPWHTGVSQDIVKCAVGNSQFVCQCGLVHVRVVMQVAYSFIVVGGSSR